MKKSGFFLLVVAFGMVLLSACSNNKPNTAKPDITKDTLTYIDKVENEKESVCSGPTDTTCAIALIYYPVFKNQVSLNAQVKKSLLSLNLPLNKKLGDADTVNDEFMHERGEYYYRFRHTSKSPIALKLYSKVLRQDSSLITLQVDGHNFSGGVDSLILFINWNTKTNKLIALNDVFKPNYMQPLTAIAEKIFLKEEMLTNTSTLARDYFFKDAKFSLNNNFVITPIGIRFVYNEREIKPAAAGTTDLFIPYSQIKSLLKPNTVLAQYFK